MSAVLPTETRLNFKTDVPEILKLKYLFIFLKYFEQTQVAFSHQKLSRTANW